MTALISASCAAPPTETGPGPQAPSATDLQKNTAKAPAAVKATAPPSPPASDVASRATPAPARPPAPPPPPRITSAELMGLADNALTRLLGAPGFQRIDDPAALWQYRGTGCILDVFLYADGPVYRVAHLEFRRAGPDNGPLEGRDTDKCISGLIPESKGKG